MSDVSASAIISSAISVAESAVWQKDENVSECTKCKKEFGFFTRKHHCRCDGLIYCSDCTDYSLPRSLVPNPALPPGTTTSDNNSEKFKVCVDCYNKVMAEEMKKQQEWSNRKQEQQPANDGFILKLLQASDSTISQSAIETVLKHLRVATTEFWSLTDLDISYMLGEEYAVDQALKIFNAKQYLMNEENWNELKIPVDAKSVACFLSKERPDEAFPLDSYRVVEFVSQLVKVTPKKSATVAVHSLILRNFARMSDEGEKLLGRQDVVSSLVVSSQFITSADAVYSWSLAICSIAYPNSNKKLFGCQAVVDSFVRVSKYATTADAVQWWSLAILNLTSNYNNESNRKLFGSQEVVDSFVALSKYATTAVAVGCWSKVISSIALLDPEYNTQLFACRSVVDSFVALSKYATASDAVLTWIGAIDNIIFSEDVCICRVFNRSSEFKQAFFNLKQKLEKMQEDEDTGEAKKQFDFVEERLF